MRRFFSWCQHCLGYFHQKMVFLWKNDPRDLWIVSCLLPMVVTAFTELLGLAPSFAYSLFCSWVGCSVSLSSVVLLVSFWLLPPLVGACLVCGAVHKLCCCCSSSKLGPEEEVMWWVGCFHLCSCSCMHQLIKCRLRPIRTLEHCTAVCPPKLHKTFG